MGKVRTIKKAEANIKEHIIKRNITIDKEKISIFLSLLERLGIEKKRGFYFLEENYKFPEFIKELSKEIRILYNLKEEALGFKLQICPPSTVSSKTYEISAGGFDLVSRVVLVVGSNENFTFKLSQRGMTVEEDFPMNRDSSFAINMGLITSIDIGFDDNKSFISKANVRGSRPETKKKDPSKRIVIVMDFLVNHGKLISTLTDQFMGESAKNPPVENLVNESMKEEDIDFFLKEIDKDQTSTKDLDDEDEGIVIVG